MGDGELRVRSKWRTQEGYGPRKLTGRCTRSIGVVQYQNESAESPGFAGFVGESRWCLRAPARNFAGLAALQTGEEEGKRRGGRGLLIGTDEGSKRQALIGIKRGGEELLCAVISRGENAGGRRRSDRWVRPDWWGPFVSEGRREIKIPVQVVTGPRAPFLAGLNRVPGVHLYIFSSFFFFLFLFSYFFSRFCILNPNQFKPLS
jgi:hypothetical protein